MSEVRINLSELDRLAQAATESTPATVGNIDAYTSLRRAVSPEVVRRLVAYTRALESYGRADTLTENTVNRLRIEHGITDETLRTVPGSDGEGK